MHRNQQQLFTQFRQKFHIAARAICLVQCLLSPPPKRMQVKQPAAATVLMMFGKSSVCQWLQQLGTSGRENLHETNKNLLLLNKVHAVSQGDG